MRCSAKRCTASGIALDSASVAIPGQQRTTSLRYMLRRARETKRCAAFAQQMGGAQIHRDAGPGFRFTQSGLQLLFHHPPPQSRSRMKQRCHFN